MRVYSVYDKTTGEAEEFFSVSEAKKWIKDRLNIGHEAYGTIYKYFSNGDFEPLGRIELKKSNKIFIANTKMKRENY
ncbi:MAG: hypothetical protein UIG52_00775 [Bacteroidales bacterium]|nr:hypothetical protein [Bacteroidales bacterium]